MPTTTPPPCLRSKDLHDPLGSWDDLEPELNNRRLYNIDMKLDHKKQKHVLQLQCEGKGYGSKGWSHIFGQNTCSNISLYWPKDQNSGLTPLTWSST